MFLASIFKGIDRIKGVDILELGKSKGVDRFPRDVENIDFSRVACKD